MEQRKSRMSRTVSQVSGPRSGWLGLPVAKTQRPREGASVGREVASILNGKETPKSNMAAWEGLPHSRETQRSEKQRRKEKI